MGYRPARGATALPESTKHNPMSLILSGIQTMFRNVPEMGKQGDKFTATLAMLIWSLDDRGKIIASNSDVGQTARPLRSPTCALHDAWPSANVDAGASSGRRMER